jgi:hypothetical protein
MEWFTSAQFYGSVALKLIGYSLFLSIWFKSWNVRNLAIAALRTVLGVLVATLLWKILPTHIHTALFYSILVIARAALWTFIWRFYYRREKAVQLVTAGTAVSCALDITMALGWLKIWGFC